MFRLVRLDTGKQEPFNTKGRLLYRFLYQEYRSLKDYQLVLKLNERLDYGYA